ncbi:MAG TPA: MazG nucleotide pyrophosphohydrolase domain-containing protein [Bradyrhizobium sp.]|uniref:MazG nucleotide pyrophosphohydrolase domain-containing protein n=1 Tax=Bradyrhizobium sp. TaxID=376 RepID=UPI002CA04175|nr:MazG nucleotide pyrophosphohydrolase domain-containing protein [Bradyrhizobium sp.]HLZ00961.1 MazG nucleotide pyrophosphohydrolase domain-containing protein [Bradyrhizobium sp.]
MKVKDYNAFVKGTDQYASKPPTERYAIALYGLVGEIGSMVSAIKKKLLGEGGETTWDQANDEIKEELGDVLWYVFSLGQILNKDYFDILANDISVLRDEIGSENERARRIAMALGPDTRLAFLEAAKSFPPSLDYTFDDYQKLAFKTARTDGRVLLEVCITVLWQLGAELLRSKLPEIELELNKKVADRPPNIVLEEITWHLCAIASLYHLSMDEVVAANCKKVRFRSQRGSEPTPLHDDDRDPKEQFPRSFDVSFIPVSPQKSRMYFAGRPLGDDLTDNAYKDDGYRFHDVLHLALIAHLGWSPVVRGLMGRKRKRGDEKIDEVEDGGRARVVEELVLKAIHSEGQRLAEESDRCAIDGPRRLFSTRSLISFRLLKMIRMFVEGHEVSRNKFWEWENAIFEGCEIFAQLRAEGQGTVHVDLMNRRLTFAPTVSPDVRGATVGMGMTATSIEGAQAPAAGLLSPVEMERTTTPERRAELISIKQSVLEALGVPKAERHDEIEVTLLPENRISVKATGQVQARAFARRVVDYKSAVTRVGDSVISTVTAIADVGDIGNS